MLNGALQRHHESGNVGGLDFALPVELLWQICCLNAKPGKIVSDCVDFTHHRAEQFLLTDRRGQNGYFAIGRVGNHVHYGRAELIITAPAGAGMISVLSSSFDSLSLDPP